jgi:hypothetical protein
MNHEINVQPYTTIPYITGISVQNKRVLSKVGCDVFLRLGQRLQNILRGKKQNDDLQTPRLQFRFYCLWKKLILIAIFSVTILLISLKKIGPKR